MTKTTTIRRTGRETTPARGIDPEFLVKLSKLNEANYHLIKGMVQGMYEVESRQAV